jgi:putative chitinase
MLLTPQQLMKVCTTLSSERATRVANAINEICPKYGIDTNDILHEFLANVAHESGEFRRLEENLNYSWLRLREVFPNRFPNNDVAKLYHRKPKEIAEKVYGFRQDLGNNHAGDGWLFRGAGFIQLTGRRNHTLFLSYYNEKFDPKYTLSQMADLLRYDYKYAMHSACWFFAIAAKLIPYAITDQMKPIVKRINGGYIGMTDRTRLYELAKKHIV